MEADSYDEGEGIIAIGALRFIDLVSTVGEWAETIDKNDLRSDRRLGYS